MLSTADGPVFRWFESWARTWHCSSDHAEAASHMPQLEEPTTKNTQLCTGGLWGEKGKNKIRSEEHTSELQSRQYLVCRLLLEKKHKDRQIVRPTITGTGRCYRVAACSPHRPQPRLNHLPLPRSTLRASPRILQPRLLVIAPLL